MKAFLVGLLITVGIMFSCSMSEAATLESVLENSVPMGKGVCHVSTPKDGMMSLECVRGLRTDGAILYCIVYGGEIVAVYEQMKADDVPKMIWNKEWKDV